MTILQELRDLMADSITIEPRSSQTVNDEGGFGAAVTYTCRVEGKILRVRDPNGDEQTSTVQVYLDQHVTIGLRDRLTLPVRFTPRQPPIINVASHVDELGTSGDMAHTIIYT